MNEPTAAPTPATSTATLTVTCLPGGRTFEANPQETILDAALRHGLLLAHSCRNGACGTCKARLTSGEVEYRKGQPAALSAEEAATGFALPCQATPVTAVALECSPISVDASTPMRRLVTRVQSLDKLAPDVMRIRLKLPANPVFAFHPGQYIDIVNAGLRRSLSVANAPADDGFIELHLRNYGGPFSTHVFNSMKVGDLIRVEGPLGTFFVRADSDKPIVFVASGTGFAPVKAMIEHQLRSGATRPMTLYWGGRRPSDLYHHDLAGDWAARHGIAYVPVVSEAAPEDAWEGRVGFVHQAVLQDIPSLAGHQVYACGAPVVVDSARRDFTTLRGLPAGEFYADAFLPGAAAPAAK